MFLLSWKLICKKVEENSNMVWRICSRASSYQCSYIPGLPNFSANLFRKRHRLIPIKENIGQNHDSKALNNSLGQLTRELGDLKVQDVGKVNHDYNLFDEMRQRFLSFKKHNYLEQIDRFRALAETQAPKIMVIGCADSRVCPSNILGFQPGEAFMIRNVANIVTPFRNGLTETNAALEFAVNTLKVEHILVVGHSNCGGIEALLSNEDHPIDSSSFLHSWVVNASVAKSRTKSAASHLSFHQQCRYCEKESIKDSMLNLLTYPWIEEKVKKDLLTVHGGFYDFWDCAFEKWTLDVNASSKNGRFVVKDPSFWC